MVVLYKLMVILAISFTLGYSQTEKPNLSGGEGKSKTLEYYESILQKYPAMPEAHFGAGNAAYVHGDYERALSEFEDALRTENPQLKSKILYNLGNTLYQQNRFEESNASYRKALELNPSDLDAKYNYELSRLMLQQLQKEQQSSRSNEQNKSDKEEFDSQQQNQSQQSDSEEEQNQAQQQSLNQTNQEQQEQQQTSAKQEEDKGQKPNAEAILNALKADEKNLMRRQLGHLQSKKLEKDW